MESNVADQAAFNLLNKLMNNKETRWQTLSLIKKANPDALIPEIDNQEPVISALQKLNAKIDGFKKEVETDKQQNQLDYRRARLRDQGYGDEGIKKIEEIMVEKSIPEHDVAAAYFDKMNPPAAPAIPSYTTQRWNFDTSGNNENFLKDTDQWVEQEVGRALSDFRSGRAA